MLQRAASNAYSWWWASHIRTKQSKWLDNNLQEMEERVKLMLKIIEEDADSFARRAEMYYKRRPELITSVEEAYRAYRALAESYDHISGELHKANHTIAAAFPDLQFGLQDDDDESSPRAITAVDPTNVPIPPAFVPQMSFGSKSRKKPAAVKKPQSPQLKQVSSFEKNTAQEEIDKLQKKILVLQTEKEFVKSSYENGHVKCWAIEKQVAEMQEEVCRLQDEFNASAVIQDDEARALMAATALRSCEDTLVNLQEEQKRSSELARIESRRIKDAKEKIRFLKGETAEPQNGTDCATDENSEEDVYDFKQQRLQLESVCEKVKEHFQTNSDTYVTELAEKIDELVNKVISLEITVSSQTVQLNVLRSETDQLHKHLRLLEEEKQTMLGDANSLAEKLKKAEEELHRIQDLENNVQNDKKILHNQFNKACNSLDDLSEKLQSPKRWVSSPTVSVTENIGTGPWEQLGKREGITTEDENISASENAYSTLEPSIPHSKLDEEMHPGIGFPTSFAPDETKPSDIDMVVMEEVNKNVEQEDKQFLLFDEPPFVAMKNSTEESANTSVEEPPPKGDIGQLKQDFQDNSRTFSQLGNVANEFHYAENDTTGVREGENSCIYQEAHAVVEHRLFCKDGKNEGRSEGTQTPGASLFNNPNQEDGIGQKELLEVNRSIGIISNEDSNDKQDQHDTLDWQKLFLSGIEGREKILLAEYTSILRSYKDVKKKLSEEDKKNDDYQSEMMAQLLELKNANNLKDEEIRLLREKLDSLRSSSSEAAQPVEVEEPCQGEPEPNFLPRLMAVSTSSRKLFSRVKNGKDRDARMSISFNVGELDGPLAEDGIKLVHIGELPVTSALEEKFRRDIDIVLEENLDFWLRFSSTFHNVQKFQTALEDLQTDLEKLKNIMAQEGSSSSGSEHAEKIDSAPTEKQLRELKTEFQVWTEQNAILREELKKRSAALYSIGEEITIALKNSETEDTHFTAYQAAKFQGEVLNMQQENNKVADELDLGLHHVNMLQDEVDKALSQLHDRLELQGPRGSRRHHHFRKISSKTRVPLRSFLFGTKPKKQSILACVHPAIQKKQSDLSSVH